MNDQLAIAAAESARLLRRGCESLLGIASGLIADGELNDKEIIFLSTWLSDNANIAGCWPGEVVLARVRDVLADGVIAPDERLYLMETLAKISGGSFADTGAIASGPNTLPVDENVDLRIAERSFCFTGQFMFGTRAACEKAVIAKGGFTAPSITQKTSYLVIGELASRAWRNTSHGIKIERAVALRAQGSQIQIVTEGRWKEALKS